MIEELTFTVSDEPGTFDRVLQAFAEQRVNVLAALALGGTFADFAIIVTICDPTDTATQVLTGLGVKYQRRLVFAIALADEPGHLARVTGVVAAVDLNVRHMYHTEYRNEHGQALTVLCLSDNERGRQALVEAGIVAYDCLPSTVVHNEPR